MDQQDNVDDPELDIELDEDDIVEVIDLDENDEGKTSRQFLRRLLIWLYPIQTTCLLSIHVYLTHKRKRKHRP